MTLGGGGVKNCSKFCDVIYGQPLAEKLNITVLDKSYLGSAIGTLGDDPLDCLKFFGHDLHLFG